MPLSEQEQRLLEEMERSLYHNDADYVAGAVGRRGRPTYSRIVLGVLVGIVGLAALITGVVVRLPIIGVIGFVLMFAGVLLALTPPRGSVPAGAAHAPHSTDAPSDSAAPSAGSSPRATGATDTNPSGSRQNPGDRSDERDE